MERFYEWGNSQEAAELLKYAFNNIESFNIINIFKTSNEELQDEVSMFMNSVDINKVSLDVFGEIYVKTSVAMLRLIRKEDNIESLIEMFEKTEDTFFYDLIENFEQDLESIDKKLLFWKKVLINFIPILKSKEEIYEYIYEISYNVSIWAQNKIFAGNTENYTYNDLWNLNRLAEAYIDDVVKYIEIEEHELLETFEIEESDKEDIKSLLVEGSQALQNGAVLIRIYLNLRAGFSYYEIMEEYRDLLFYKEYLVKIEEYLSANENVLSEALSFCDSILAWQGFIDVTNEIMKKHDEEVMIKINLIKVYIDDILEKLKCITQLK